MRDVDAFQLYLAVAAYRDRVYHGADGRHAVGFRAPLFEADSPRRTPWQRLSPTRHLRCNVERADHVVLVRQAGPSDEFAPISIGVDPCGTSELIHEAFAIELVRGLANATPRADGDVKFRRMVREAVVRHVIPRAHIERRFRAKPVLLHQS